MRLYSFGTRRYIQIADAIEEAYPNIVVDGNVDADGRKGSFEITGATGRCVTRTWCTVSSRGGLGGC